MNLSRSLAQFQKEHVLHVLLERECVDRMYLDASEQGSSEG